MVYAVGEEDKGTKGGTDPCLLGLWAPDPEWNVGESWQVKENQATFTGQDIMLLLCLGTMSPDSGSQKCSNLLKITKLMGERSGFNSVLQDPCYKISALLSKKTTLFLVIAALGHHEQQSLLRHPLWGGMGSPAWEPVQAPAAFGDSGVVAYQLEGLWPSKGQMILGQPSGLSPVPAPSTPSVLSGTSSAVTRPRLWISPTWTSRH